MKQCGAIFDVDGTILDSMPWWEKADYISLEKLGITPTREIQENFAKQTLAETAVYISELDGGKITPKQARELVLATMLDAYKNEIELKPGIMQYLQNLKSRGVKMIIATSGEKRCVELAFARFGIADFFEGILTADDVGKGKNFPDIFLKAASMLGTTPSETVVYEDSLHAIQTAKAAGFVTVGIYDEFSKARWEEINSTADFAWEDFTEGLK